jgi:CheY-like chemotaxis protein
MTEKILVVEDNEMNRTLLRDLLEHYGYEVAEAVNGAEGVELARKYCPGLILLDIQMPVMNGFTSIGVMKNDPALCGTKIVALTSFAMKGDRERFMAAGFDGYLSKPVDTRTLPGLVKEWFEKERDEQ